MKIHTITKEFLADLFTPVGLFIKIREQYSQVLLLESSDYASKENSHSFICFDPIAGVQVDDKAFKSYTGKQTVEVVLQANIHTLIEEFQDSMAFSDTSVISKFNGLFGYSNYDSIEHFETIELHGEDHVKTPCLRYDLYRYIIAFDHFYETLTLLENIPEGKSSGIEGIEQILLRQDHSQLDFKLQGDISSSSTDEEYMGTVTKAKEHCQRGDVFQVVLSRRYMQKFVGDEFNVYRALRSVNPSPYLFYFDYSYYRLFGSSPEAQIIIQENQAEIHPIAGTVPKTGDEAKDNAYAQQLIEDPKENAEHVMLVDLARNDLSRNCTSVHVDSYKEIQRFSHVMHLTSKVKGDVNAGVNNFQIFADTFPAGTLSGAPKYRAMQIIDTLEPHKRGFYGGAIGLLSFEGEINQAIIIRSFLSTKNTLHWQAGAGIVIDSKEEKELEEVKNKLGALNKALKKAEHLI